MITTIVPTSSILQQYISFYYFFDVIKPKQIHYCSFPHTGSAITFLNGAEITRKDHEIFIQGNMPGEMPIDILGRFTQPIRISYNGDFEEITIIFKPMGVNRFIRQDFSAIASSFSQSFDDKCWQFFASSLFSSPDRIAVLEQFLLSKLEDHPSFIKVEEALPYFENQQEGLCLPAIAGLLNMTVKSFQRLFSKHMACTPSDYRRIARFRKSLDSKLHAPGIKSLTHICYENNYFDQSYFIKEFKKLTTRNPKDFFRAIQMLHNDKLVWELI